VSVDNYCFVFGTGCFVIIRHTICTSTPTIEKESNKPTQKTTETNTSTDTVGAKQKLGKRITIGSLNIQNIRGNTIFAQSIMKETEILFIQEHWLFKFEEKEFTTLIPNTDHYVRFIGCVEVSSQYYGVRFTVF
jgi:hypothetical protein